RLCWHHICLGAARATSQRSGVSAPDSKYLLTGFAQCAGCGGNLMARSRDYGSTRKFGAYHHQRGRTVCVERALIERAIDVEHFEEYEGEHETEGGHIRHGPQGSVRVSPRSHGRAST